MALSGYGRKDPAQPKLPLPFCYPKELESKELVRIHGTLGQPFSPGDAWGESGKGHSRSHISVPGFGISPFLRDCVLLFLQKKSWIWAQFHNGRGPQALPVVWTRDF